MKIQHEQTAAVAPERRFRLHCASARRDGATRRRKIAEVFFSAPSATSCSNCENHERGQNHEDQTDTISNRGVSQCHRLPGGLSLLCRQSELWTGLGAAVHRDISIPEKALKP